MSFYAAGVNHQSCPVDVRERLSAVGAEAAARLLEGLGWREAVVLSTCNRFELYAAGPGPERRLPLESLQDALRALAETDASFHVYSWEGEAAIRHLFQVASGLDSLVLGESEILGQVKKAYEGAQAAGLTRKRTNVLFQRALFVGKGVRRRTNISMGQVSVASVAVELAKRIFGGLADKTVLVLGAGEMAVKTARHLQSAKASRLCLSNRTWAKAAELAEALKAEAVPWESFPARLADVDIVVASTGASRAVVTREMVERILGRRDGRSLFFIDIAMPRDVEAGVHDLEGVYVYGLGDLSAIVQENMSRRTDELSAAETILRLESAKLAVWLAELDAGRESTFRHSDMGAPRPSAVARECRLGGSSGRGR